MNNPNFIRPGMTGDLDATAETLKDSAVEPSESTEADTEAARRGRENVDPMRLEIDHSVDPAHPREPHPGTADKRS